MTTPAFDDVVIAVAAALRDLGHTTVNAGGYDPDRINGKAVVAEVDPDDDDDGLAAGIVAVPYARLVDACAELVRDDTARSALESVGHRIISRRTTAHILDRVLHFAAALDPMAGAWGPRY
ncbi:hypothetical protein [Nocardia sp. NPDC051570]|uniref:hypothetical protein n=1 Tax=Nocardia sp. NPDC051570 TaxID=3364324 RepID=UPI00378B01CA